MEDLLRSKAHILTCQNFSSEADLFGRWIDRNQMRTLIDCLLVILDIDGGLFSGSWSIL